MPTKTYSVALTLLYAKQNVPLRVTTNCLPKTVFAFCISLHCTIHCLSPPPTVDYTCASLACVVGVDACSAWLVIPSVCITVKITAL